MHVPFCIRKCAYCDLYSVAADRAAIADFRGLLVREMDLFRREFPGEAAAPADTVFFGGGTPTALGAEGLVTLLAAVRAGGFNRVSIGVQSFDPEMLKILGRVHGVAEIRAAWRDARAAGFPTIGLDLIFGIPGQTAPSFAADLERSVALRPSHVSAYAL